MFSFQTQIVGTITFPCISLLCRGKDDKVEWIFKGGLEYLIWWFSFTWQLFLKICLSYVFDALSWMLHPVGPIYLCIRNDLLTCCTFLYFFSSIWCCVSLYWRCFCCLGRHPVCPLPTPGGGNIKQTKDNENFQM